VDGRGAATRPYEPRQGAEIDVLVDAFARATPELTERTPLTTLAAITIGIDPTIDIGPVTLAWHGLTIALDILAGAAVAARDLHRRGLGAEPLYALLLCVTAGALVSGRVF
jgi:hypothetical protein